MDIADEKLGDILLRLLEEDDPRAHTNKRDDSCFIVDGEFDLQAVAVKFRQFLETAALLANGEVFLGASVEIYTPGQSA